MKLAGRLLLVLAIALVSASAFTINGLGNKMREWYNAAGLPQCSSHGLRKAALAILPENGATAPELCALYGGPGRTRTCKSGRRKVAA
jgi:hypothetical protein